MLKEAQGHPVEKIRASEVLGLLPRNPPGVIPVQAPDTACQR